MSAPLDRYSRIREKLLLDDCGILCCRFNDEVSERCVPVIPSTLRQVIINWPGMSSDIIHFSLVFSL